MATEIVSSRKTAMILAPAEIRDMAKKNLDTLVVVF
jgi:hypothetical protein